ncbi:MAG: hypothetical protein US86_C0001G0065 [Candidatus Daviesbacteria bacterium GW2011_GWA2_38_24]|uniref:O-antigen ligase-related domain-containing protein n=1 Tax=Candidatus Daviesbacteria bacterium GW2011_GWA2_38_24 TaxID=1618422 RepID=A0A0G0JHJ6_9BACT|nr:MAG: hypothetical protein US86_C0001G0065 [Candidatus Daviesbacteria bacterium GW2011_GWA2_38_24]KKQ79191.1 MAG: hypothetical protein UT01_C0048G0010 [Candidatus Daviesbacteria bacterium GW2011_GWA1_38_7]OGE23123.1 MAG: hypothetical protein A2688_03695 [Candidatus Daviesbacteria bacterium RIFCSPHIGHO2_01_FULL_38_8]
MNLIWFLSIGTFISLMFGEFGRFPFGGGTVSVTVLDLLLLLTVSFLSIWQISIKKDLKFFKCLNFFVPFLIIAMLSLILSGNLKGGLYLIRFSIYTLSFWIGYSVIFSKVSSLININKLISIVGLILSILGLLQLIVYPNLDSLTSFGYDPHQGRLVSTWLDPNFLGAFLNISLILTIYLWTHKKEKTWGLIGFVILLSIILTFSRSAYLFLLVTLFIWGYFKFRKLLSLALVVILLSYLISPRFAERINGAVNIDKSARERFVSWKSGVVIFQQKPLLGVGFNNLRYAYKNNNLIKTYSEDGGHSGAGVDSSLIFVLATTGVLGFLGYMYFWYKVLQDHFNLSSLSLSVLSIFLGLLINSQFINSLFFPPLMFTLFFWLGAVKAFKDFQD